MSDNQFHNYLAVKRALERSEQEGFIPEFRGEVIFLKRKNQKIKSPEFPFFTANEIHTYLNGLNDGKFAKDEINDLPKSEDREA